jgi:hypothetical protein
MNVFQEGPTNTNTHPSNFANGTFPKRCSFPTNTNLSTEAYIINQIQYWTPHLEKPGNLSFSDFLDYKALCKGILHKIIKIIR